MTTTSTNLRYIDSDGHILEHPTGMPDYAPAEYRDRIWHIETDNDGVEMLHYDNVACPANMMAAAGTAGMSDEDRARAFQGEMRYTEVRPAVQRKAGSRTWTGWHRPGGAYRPCCWACKATPTCPSRWRRPVQRLGVGSRWRAKGGCSPPVQFAIRPTTSRPWPTRSAASPRCRHGLGVHASEPPSSGAIRTPYDPIWQASADTGLPIAMHPFLQPDLPGACQGLRLQGCCSAKRSPTRSTSWTRSCGSAGRVQRFPDAVHLPRSQRWVDRPLAQRLDTTARSSSGRSPTSTCSVGVLPPPAGSASTPTDHAGLHRRSPLVGADRIIWASDYPHPDAKFPGVTEELTEALEG